LSHLNWYKKRRALQHGAEDAVLQVEVSGNVALEDWQRAGDGDVMVDEELDERGGVRTVGSHAGEGWIANRAGTKVGLLAGIELGIYKEAVLQIIDAEFRGLGIGDGAEVAGDLEAVLVGFVDGGFELGAGDVHVRLVTGDSNG
jgi:hypothetical protein